jgi:protein involved in polysaccharide export with SLBB domain
MPFLRSLLAAGALCAVAALPVAAQQVPGAELSQVLVSRQSLEDLANRLEQTAESRTFSGAVRNSARAQAVLVRTRLRDGDFQVGDRILLTVDAETALTRQFVVLAGRQIDLPGVGLLPMAGVLRAELTEYVRANLARYLRDPKVRAQTLIRIVIIDGVARQGWLVVPVDIPLDSVLALAGGLSGQAQINKIRIQRDGEDLYSGLGLQRMISNGATVDALSMQQGDLISVPISVPQTPESRVRTFMFLIQLPLSLYALAQLLGL